MVAAALVKELKNNGGKARRPPANKPPPGLTKDFLVAGRGSRMAVSLYYMLTYAA